MTDYTIPRSRSLALLLGAAAATALPRPARAEDTVIRIGASPAVAQALPFLAQRLGYLKRANITLDIQKFTGPAALQAVVGGDLDIGATTPISIANAVLHGIGIRMLGADSLITSDRPPFGFYVDKRSPIHAARDLQGKTIAVNSLGDSQTLGIWAWMEKNGVAHESAHFVETVFSTIPSALKSGRVDAADLGEPFIAANKDELREIPGVYETLGKRWAIQAFYVSNAFADRNPDLVKRFMGAMFAAAKEINHAPPAELEPYIASYSGIAPADVHGMRQQVFAESADPASIQQQLDLAYKFKLIPRAVTVADLAGARS